MVSFCNLISPESIGIFLEIAFNRVDLPLPFIPTSPTRSSLFKVKEIFLLYYFLLIPLDSLRAYYHLPFISVLYTILSLFR